MFNNYLSFLRQKAVSREALMVKMVVFYTVVNILYAVIYGLVVPDDLPKLVTWLWGDPKMHVELAVATFLALMWVNLATYLHYVSINSQSRFLVGVFFSTCSLGYIYFVGGWDFYSSIGTVAYFLISSVVR